MNIHIHNTSPLQEKESDQTELSFKHVQKQVHNIKNC